MNSTESGISSSAASHAAADERTSLRAHVFERVKKKNGASLMTPHQRSWGVGHGL
jgi:hypothetical protein